MSGLADGPLLAYLVFMKNRFSILVLSMAVILSTACEKSAKDDMRDAGHDMKDAAKATGRAADKVVDKAADKVQEGAQKVKDKTKP